MTDKELLQLQSEIEAHAKSFGLDFFKTIFELIDGDHLNEVAAYGGFPTRYPHWRFGMEFDHLAKGYEYGLQKIYELVINNDPCFAYLMRSNTLVDQKLVIAHVYGHCDFFKNNQCFAKTNRKMMNGMANHASKIVSFREKYGEEVVESFIDVCLSIENLISVYDPYVFEHEKLRQSQGEIKKVDSFPNDKEYMDEFVNPKAWVEQKKLETEKRKKEKAKKIPEKKEKDILGFLIDHAPLTDWQKEVLLIIRDEAYYFAPQMQTKIMNEGWASYWHSRIMTEKVLKDKEVIDFADRHAGTVSTSPGNINPYKLGLEIYRDIEDRWNKGKFGQEYRECKSLEEKHNWDRKLGKGRDKIFEVRRNFNDITFIDEFLTDELCETLKLYVYAFNKRNGTYEIVDRDHKKIKDKLLNSLTNFGAPIMAVVDGNYEGKNSLLLEHEHYGIDLKLADTKETLERIHKIWKKPVHLQTVINGEKRLLSFDGKEHRERAI